MMKMKVKTLELNDYMYIDISDNGKIIGIEVIDKHSAVYIK